MADPLFSAYGSEQQWLPKLTVISPFKTGALAGLVINITFDKFSGGDVTANPPKYRPAGMGDEISYTALPTYSDAMLTKAFEQADLLTQSQLRRLAGRAQATVTLVPLDDTGLAWGNNRVYSGRLASVKDGNTDSTSSAVRSWDVTVSVDTISG
jgi:hypothetical protein